LLVAGADLRLIQLYPTGINRLAAQSFDGPAHSPTIDRTIYGFSPTSAMVRHTMQSILGATRPRPVPVLQSGNGLIIPQYILISNKTIGTAQ
jgi:hypothetical protein